MGYTFLDRWCTDRNFFVGCFLVILLYFLPYVVLGENSSLVIHDNLDSNLVWVKMILDNGGIFSSPSFQIDQVLNGMSRSSLYGIYDFSLVWFNFFGMYWGYVINKFLMAVVGFIGMYLLLKKYFLPADALKIIPFGVALIFGLLPFWSFTMTVAGLPLLLFAFLNIRGNNNHYSNWIIVALFPFYSGLILSGFFFLLIVTLILIYDTIKEKKINYNFLLAIALLSALYVVSHFPLFFSFLYNSGYTSHRIEFKSPSLSLIDAIRSSLTMFIVGQYHAQSLQILILIPVFLGLLLILKSDRIDKRYVIILIFIFLTSALYGFLDWGLISNFKRQMMSIIPLKLERFHFLHPMLWYVLFGISLVVISKRFRFGKQAVLLFLIVQFLYVLKQHEVFENRNKPSFREFYSVRLFDEIKTFIKAPQNSYRVISLGIHPAIAQYNGFYTLDGYFPDYSLNYKRDFRRIISPELGKDLELMEYFDNWGARCYAFSSELRRDFLNPKPKKVENLEFDFNVLKQMGGKYVLSSAEISGNNKLDLLKKFKHVDSYWTIYLYRVL